jgi:hypothetical protein
VASLLSGGGLVGIACGVIITYRKYSKLKKKLEDYERGAIDWDEVDKEKENNRKREDEQL